MKQSKTVPISSSPPVLNTSCWTMPVHQLPTRKENVLIMEHDGPGRNVRTQCFSPAIGIGDEVVGATGSSTFAENGRVVGVSDQKNTQRLHYQVSQLDFLFAYHIFCENKWQV